MRIRHMGVMIGLLLVFGLVIPLGSAEYYDSYEAWKKACKDEANYAGMCAKGEWGNKQMYQGDRCFYEWKEDGIECDANLADVAYSQSGNKEYTSLLHGGSAYCNGKGVGCYIGGGTCNQGTCQLRVCDIDNDGDGVLSCLDNIWPGVIPSGPGYAGPNQYLGVVDTDYGGVARTYNLPISYITDCDEGDASINSLHYNPRASDVELISIDFPKEIDAGWFKIESYKDRTEKDRKFIPREPYSPYDEIEITVKFRKHLECNTRWDLIGGKIVVLADGGELFKTDRFEVIEVYEDSINKGAFPDKFGFYTPGIPEGVRWNSLIKGKNPEYRIILKGWSNGITQNEADMEKLVDAISQGRAISFRIEDAKGEKIETPRIPMTNCVRLYGDGEQAIVFSRAEIEFEQPQLKGESVGLKSLMKWSTDGYQKLITTSPFKEYKSHLSSIIDLNKFEHTTLFSPSKCKDENLVDVRFDNFNYAGVEGNAGLGNVRITGAGKTSKLSEVIVHEVGHVVGRLSDEYAPYEDKMPDILDNTNCLNNYDVSQWGNFANPKTGCIRSKYLSRSTKDSIMNYGVFGDIHKFNIVSCGYLIKGITNAGTGQSHWPECSRLDTVKPGDPSWA